MSGLTHDTTFERTFSQDSAASRANEERPRLQRAGTEAHSMVGGESVDFAIRFAVLRPSPAKRLLGIRHP